MIRLYIRMSAAFLCGILLFHYQSACGQTAADTLKLDEIRVTATRIQQPLQLQPTNIQVVDSTLLRMNAGRTIGEVLSSSSTLFIKDNGPGALAIASQRGLSSEQVQVLWEGIPINNVMLGQTDFSLLPSALFSGVQVSSGNPSTAFGGGSMSGAIYLSSDFTSRNRVSYRQGVGSFGQWQSALNAQYQSGKWSGGLRSTVSRAENDYEYYHRVYDRQARREHNRQEQENVMATVGYRSGVKEFETKFWIQNSENQLPGTVLQSGSEARQDDRSLRWLSTYGTRWRDIDITVKNYLDQTNLNYFNPESDTRSLSTFRRWMGAASFDYTLSEYTLLKGEVSGGLSGVDTNNYTGLKTRRQVSVLVNPELSVFSHRLKVYPALRFDSYSDFGRVVSPSLGLNYELLYDQLYLRGQLSRDFNPPTFNALYWGQGGNPELQPERSNSAEAGLVYNLPLRGIHSVALTGYYNRVQNGIRWYPDQSGTHTPENVEGITSQGIEGTLKNRWGSARGWEAGVRQAVSFTQAEITEPRFRDDAAPGHQMRYIPKWQYQASMDLTYHGIKALLQYNWTSRRYYTETESFTNSLDPYHLLHATLQASREVAGLNLTARGSVRNLLGSRYEIIQWYAMPQRNYHFSLTATYNF